MPATITKRMTKRISNVTQREGFSHNTIGSEFGFSIEGIVFGKALALMIFIGKGLNHPHPTERVFDTGIKLTHTAKKLAKSGGHLAAKVHGDPQNDGDHKKGQ